MYLHPESLSPDPTYGRERRQLGENRCGMTVWPFALVRVSPQQPEAKAWAERLDLFGDPGELSLEPDAGGRVELVVDFGTELDARLEVALDAPSTCNVTVTFGESLPEAEGEIPGGMPRPEVMWHIPAAGEHSRRLDVLRIFDRTVEDTARGFRYVRLSLYDLAGPVRLRRIAAEAEFTFTRRPGDLRCSDRRFQRLWQSSAYTARLCTRPDAFWDGIKRDRMGWFGDARITKAAVDAVYFDPGPTEAMLPQLPTDEWGNGIPNYSFDAIAMLRRHVLTFGADAPVVAETFGRIAELLDWARRTQTDDGGFIVRTERPYFGDIGFVDWSPAPVGGRLEELCWLQCKYVEGLRHAARVAEWLGRRADADRWLAEADRLGRRIVAEFWREGVGFIHTLNHVGPVGNPRIPGADGHYRKTYVEGIALGPSGPSRQANALAVLAGLCDEPMRRSILRDVLDNDNVGPIVTPYFAYWEQSARARCGDAAGALERFRDYLGGLLEREDAATLWELYDPEVRDLRKYYSHLELGWDWPLSLCHGWGSGAVPLATRWLLGIEPTRPGFGAVAIDAVSEVPWTFEATLPTPHGPIRVQRRAAGGEILYEVPPAVEIERQPPKGVKIGRS